MLFLSKNFSITRVFAKNYIHSYSNRTSIVACSNLRRKVAKLDDDLTSLIVKFSMNEERGRPCMIHGFEIDSNAFLRIRKKKRKKKNNLI